MNHENIPASRSAVISFVSICLMIAFSLFPTESIKVRADAAKTEFFNEPETAVGNSDVSAGLNLVIQVGQDGIAAMNTTADQLNTIFVCASNPTAGCDFSQNNGVVRTNDSVVYSYDYSVNGASDDITITATAPIGTVWSVLPAFCNSGSTKNTGDGITSASVISCKRGVQAIGTSESLPFTAVVLGSVNHGTILTATGAVSGPGSSTVNAGAPNVTATAAPRFNLRKGFISYNAFTLGGVPGYRIEYRAMIEVFDDSIPAAFNPRYGSAALASPITFTDVVSQISPNAVLQTCGKLTDSTGSNGGNGGTMSCTQTAAGQNIAFSVSGANSTLSQYAVAPADGRFLVGTYQIFIFIPQTDVTNAPGQSLSTVNTLTDFDPTSASGQSNFNTGTENTTDNFANRTFTPLTGSFGKAYVRDYNSASTTTFGVAVGGNRFVAPGEIFASQISLNNNTGAPLDNVVLCDVMDNSKYSVTETAPGSGIVYGNDATAPTAVEYATGYVNANWLPTTTGGNSIGIRAECSDANITWYSSPSAVPGGLAAITKFRVKYSTLAVGAVGTVRVRLQARENNFYTSQTNFNGAVLPNFATWRSDQLVPNYANNTYFQNVYPNNQSGSVGARLFLARAIARITKETESNNTVNSIATGGTIGYVLKPTLSTVGTPNSVQVSVMDVLPMGLTYIVGTGQQNNASFEPQIIGCTAVAAPDSHCTAAGQQLLVWTLNNQTPNAAIPPISFRAAADLSVVNNQTVVNTAIVSSPADPSQETSRTATRNVTGASPSTLLIFKNTNTPQIEAGSPFAYTVSYRNSSLAADFTNLDFIDVLPFNGDAALAFDTGTVQRTPASNFAGTRALTGVSATTGAATWYFTDAAPASVNASPKFASNLNPGAAGSIWCAGTAVGPAAGCGFTLAQTTAVRLLDNTPLPHGTAIRSFTLNFASNGNQSNNRYTNNSSGSAAELALAINSNNVPIIVLESSLGGVVWFDTNGDGVRGVEETGRIGVSTVTLSGTDSNNNPVARTTSTAANGTYTFGQLPIGTYTVQFTRPANYRSGVQDNGSDDSIDSDGNPATLLTPPISLGVNESKTNIDQGFFQMNLSGTVWRDTNDNGLLDNAEAGVSGVAVDLLDGNSAVLQTGSTGGGGIYSFDNLAAGDYRVRVASNGFVGSSVTIQNANNNVDGDNNGIQQTGFVISNPVTLNPGIEPTVSQSNGVTSNSTVDFGLTTAPTAGEVTIGGRVSSAGGRGIGKATVTIIAPNGSVRYAITNPFGYYRFNGVEAGTTVVISIAAKNAVFNPKTKIISVLEDNHEVNFAADDK